GPGHPPSGLGGPPSDGRSRVSRSASSSRLSLYNAGGRAMPSSVPQNPRRTLPSIDRLLAEPRVTALIALYGRDQLRVQAQNAVAELRARLAGPPADDEGLATEVGGLPERIAELAEAAYGDPLKRTLNATGIFLHTNLGRAPLPKSVARALPELLDGGCDLEVDLETGRRGERNRRA